MSDFALQDAMSEFGKKRSLVKFHEYNELLVPYRLSNWDDVAKVP